MNAMNCLLSISLVVLITFITPTHANTSTSNSPHTTMSDAQIQKKLTQHHRKNAAELLELIRQERFDDVEAFIRYTEKNKILTRDGFPYFQTMLEYWFTQHDSEAILTHLNNWITQNGKNTIALIARGDFYVTYAWKARGGGWAKDVKEEAWKLFRERLAKGRADYMRAVAHDPHNIYVYTGLMRIGLGDGDGERIFSALFQRAMVIAPDSYKMHHLRLQTLMPKWGGDWEAMFRFARETEKKAPPKTLLPVILALAHQEAAARSDNRMEYYSQPDVWKDIERVYQRVISDFPQSGYWKTVLGWIASRAGKAELAREYWLSALETDHNDRDTIDAIIRVYEREKKWDLVEKYSRQLIELYPNESYGYDSLGRLLTKAKKYREAIDIYNHVIALSPQTMRYWAERCYLHNTTEEFTKAIQDCTRAVEIDGKFARGYGRICYASNRLGKYSDAVKACTQAIGLSPSAEYWTNRCYAYNRLGNFTQALHDCNKALEFDKNYSYAYHQRAYAHRQLGQKQLSEDDQRMCEKITQSSCPLGEHVVLPSQTFPSNP